MDKSLIQEPLFTFSWIFAMFAAFALFDGILDGFDLYTGVTLTLCAVLAVWLFTAAKRTATRNR
jgi:hypothetical protein